MHSTEEIEIHTDDGRALRATVHDVKKPRGVAVLAHAMMARRIEFERPRGGGLARFLAERGWRTVAFDFRGHGDSGPAAADGGAWGYDDLTLRDLPAVVASARARARKAPVVVFGHSLGAHCALAAQGLGLLKADAIVSIAGNIWMKRLEPSVARWAVKRATMEAVHAICARRGYFPARVLRLGSDDESAPYFADFARFVRTGVWGSADGARDYFAALARVDVPVFGITSDGDKINCHPVCGERFLAPVPRHAIVRVRRADDGGAAPGHMQLVTTEAAKSAWEEAATFAEGVG